MSQFEEDFRKHLKAGCAGIWVQTRETPETQAAVLRVCRDESGDVYSWDAEMGFQEIKTNDGMSTGGGEQQKMPPNVAIRTVFTKMQEGRKTVLCLHNFHDFMKSPEVRQALLNSICLGKKVGVFYVILSPFMTIPEELQTYFAQLRHTPPAHDEIKTIVNHTLNRAAESPLQRTTLEALSGLQRYEIEQELGLCLANNEAVTPKMLWNAKARSLEKGGFLKLHRGGETFKDVKGMAQLKDFTLRAFREGRRKPAKGVCLVGVSGAGKSLFAKSLGNEIDRVSVFLKIGSLLGSLVGQSESNLRTVLDQVEANSPCVLFLDEIEKDMQGNASGNDSGVMARIFGTFLTWRQETKADVFVVATANNVQTLPYEFLRPGRFDATFFIDLPTREERDSILAYHMGKSEIDEDYKEVSKKLDLEGWTGAEIEQLCYLVSEMSYTWEEASVRVPVNVKRAPQSIQQIREFASGWALSAANPGIYYHRPSTNLPSIRRKVETAAASSGGSENFEL